MKTYDLVKQLLETYPKARNSDKFLMFCVWNKEGLLNGKSISYDNFMKATSPETIRRCRQKIQEKTPSLRPTNEQVTRFRNKQAKQKGTHIYREQTLL